MCHGCIVDAAGVEGRKDKEVLELVHCSIAALETICFRVVPDWDMNEALGCISKVGRT